MQFGCGSAINAVKADYWVWWVYIQTQITALDFRKRDVSMRSRLRYGLEVEWCFLA